MQSKKRNQSVKVTRKHINHNIVVDRLAFFNIKKQAVIEITTNKRPRIRRLIDIIVYKKQTIYLVEPVKYPEQRYTYSSEYRCWTALYLDAWPISERGLKKIELEADLTQKEEK